MFRIGSYLKFLLRSTNHHGVHSPFVYLLITRCIYSRKKQATDSTLKIICKQSDGINVKEAKLLLRLASYFDTNTVLILESVQQELAQVMELHTISSNIDTTVLKPQYDFIIAGINEISDSKVIFRKLLKVMHNDSILLLRDIHSQPENEAYWQALRKNEAVKVSIDLYTIGLIFIRKEQVKEHFIIRW